MLRRQVIEKNVIKETIRIENENAILRSQIGELINTNDQLNQRVRDLQSELNAHDAAIMDEIYDNVNDNMTDDGVTSYTADCTQTCSVNEQSRLVNNIKEYNDITCKCVVM